MHNIVWIDDIARHPRITDNDSDYYNNGECMTFFMDQINAIGDVQVSCDCRIVTIDDHALPRYSVIAKPDMKDGKGLGLTVHVQGYNVTTFRRRKDGSYDWKRIIEKMKRIAAADKAIRRI